MRIAIVCALLVSATTARGQDRVERLERRLDELEKKYEADLRAHDEEIAKLRAELEQREHPTTAEVQHTKEQVQLDAEDRCPLTLRRPFNPAIGVVIDAAGSWSNQRSNPAWNRFDVREVEVDLRAPIERRVDGVFVMTLEREVENPPFPDASVPASDEVETGADIEEAYALFHDFGVDGLAAKLGRFHLRFGRQNVLHLHELPTTDPPLVNQAFLADEALIDSGLSVSYVLPPHLVAQQRIELVGEVVSGDEISEDAPALNLRAQWDRELAHEVDLALGGSWLTAQDVNVAGFDVTFHHGDHLIQAELMRSSRDGERAWGAYLLGQREVVDGFFAGLRLDWTEDAADDAQELWAVSPYVSWYLNPSLRFRLQYQHRGGDVADADVVYLQATYIFGQHQAHDHAGHDHHAHEAEHAH